MRNVTQPYLNSPFQLSSRPISQQIKKELTHSQQTNPLRNIKLQTIKDCCHKRNQIMIMDSQPSHEGEIEKMEMNGVDSNESEKTNIKLKIVKEERKNVYNMVFDKKFIKNTTVTNHKFPQFQIKTQTHRNSWRTLRSSESVRKTPPIRNQIQPKNYQFPKSIVNPTQLKISGNKAPTCQTIDHLRKNSKNSINPKALFYETLYSSKKNYEDYL